MVSELSNAALCSSPPPRQTSPPFFSLSAQSFSHPLLKTFPPCQQNVPSAGAAVHHNVHLSVSLRLCDKTYGGSLLRPHLQHNTLFCEVESRILLLTKIISLHVSCMEIPRILYIVIKPGEQILFYRGKTHI